MFQEKFSMFASHSRWDGGEVRKLVPNAFSLTTLQALVVLDYRGGVI